MKKGLKIIEYSLPVLSILLVFFVWELNSMKYDSVLIFPSVKLIFKELLIIFKESSFYTAVWNTFSRALISFAISLLIALITAILAFNFKFFQKFLYPIISILRATPTISIILLIIIFTLPEVSPIYISFLVIFPLLYSAFLNAFLGIDKRLIEMSKLYGVSFFKIVTTLYIPLVFKSVLSEIGGILSFSVKIVVSAEVLALTRFSLGYYMQVAKINLEIATLMAYTIVAIILGVILEQIVNLIKKLTIRWQ